MKTWATLAIMACYLLGYSNSTLLFDSNLAIDGAILECNLFSPIVGVGGTHIICAGEEAEITVTAEGGTAPYTYSIDGGFITQSQPSFSVQAGIYTIKTYDALVDEAECTVEILEPHPTEVYLAEVEDLCQMDEGEIEIQIEGGVAPYTISHTSATGGTLDQDEITVAAEGGSAVFTGAKGGETYNIIVVDANGCHDVSWVTLTIEGSSTGQPLQVVGVSENGSIDLTVTGGSPSYSFEWTGPDNFISNQEDISILTAGDYSVVVTDDNNCTAFSDFVVSAADSKLEAPHFCLVTNDINSGKNVLLWEDPISIENIAEYNIYREGSSDGNFEWIGNNAASEINEFIDTDSNSASLAYRYHITSVDKNGKESEPSNKHKTIHLTTSQGLNGNINLNWDSYEGLDYDQVTVYRGTKEDNMMKLLDLPAGNFSYTDLTPPAGPLYYQLVIAVNVECITNKANYDVKSNVIFLDELSGTEELFSDYKFYPNPVHNLLYVESEKALHLVIENNVGQVISEINITVGTNEILTTEWEAGMYYMQFSDSISRWTERIVITN